MLYTIIKCLIELFIFLFLLKTFSQERTNPISRGRGVIQSEAYRHLGGVGSARGPDVSSCAGRFKDGDSSCRRTQATNHCPNQHRWAATKGWEKRSMHCNNSYFIPIDSSNKHLNTFHVFVTQDCLYHHPVHKISFIAQDMSDSRAFGYIFGSPDTGHRFFGIKTDKAASQVRIISKLFCIYSNRKLWTAGALYWSRSSRYSLLTGYI